MAVTGNDTAGNWTIFCSDATADATVIAFLRGITNDGNGGRIDVAWTLPCDGRAKAASLNFKCDRETAQAALRLSGATPTLETGVQTANRFSRVGSDW